MSLCEIDNDSFSNTSFIEKEFNLSKYKAEKVLKFVKEKNFIELEKLIPNYKNNLRFKKLTGE